MADLTVTCLHTNELYPTSSSLSKRFPFDTVRGQKIARRRKPARPVILCYSKKVLLKKWKGAKGLQWLQVEAQDWAKPLHWD